YTTALGLSIAIPTFIAYKYIKGRHENLVTILEEESKKILEIFSPRK
nr:MotA/TolQ/ExbB proton channel family protein [Candidatus Dadabacteria bacterium]NIQ13017.1 MotA/TolQ/ExbB proton channel family protein [Candidatus Dadabacteria bacterium]